MVNHSPNYVRQTLAVALCQVLTASHPQSSSVVSLLQKPCPVGLLEDTKRKSIKSLDTIDVSCSPCWGSVLC